MVALLLIAVVAALGLTIGWGMLASETSPRAANGVLILFATAGLVTLIASTWSNDAG